MISSRSGRETKELTSTFNGLALDVHRKAALLNAALSKAEFPCTLPSRRVIHNVINLIAKNHRLIEAGTQMVNEGVDGGAIEANGTIK